MILGIDLGTSSVKAVLFDPETGGTLASAGQEYPIHQPLPHFAEQKPDEWWEAVVNVVRRVTVDHCDITAIGLTGQMHGTVLLDSNAQAIHPAIIWADQRSASESRKLIEKVGAERLASITGTLPATGFMAATLLWLSRHRPDLKPFKVVLPKDVIRQCLTGEIATDVSDAASTGLFDITRRQWSSVMLETVGISLDLMPPVFESASITAGLTKKSAELLGLSAGIPVVAGCADQPAQALANGIITPSKMSVTTGTGGQVFIPLKSSAQTDPRLHVFNHAIPDTWYSLGAILSAGLSLRWLRQLVGLSENLHAYEILSAEAALVPPGADGLIFLPYLVGERTPHMDAHARGGFIGLSYHHGRGHLARAVMEGVAFALRQTFEISRTFSGEVETIIAAGGGAESDVWRQIQADVFGLPLQKTLVKEQTSVGAALLAAVGTGVYSSFEESCSVVSRYGDVTEPNPQYHQHYNALYEQFVSLYPRLKDDFRRLSGG